VGRVLGLGSTLLPAVPPQSRAIGAEKGTDHEDQLVVGAQFDLLGSFGVVGDFCFRARRRG
jgi:hypothetical protein